jgi:hypothetical protein
VERACLIALCFMAGCADSVDQAARAAYELTLPAAGDGSGWSVQRESGSRVTTWQIRNERSWREYAEWVRPRLMRSFDSVEVRGNNALVFSKALDGDRYTLEVRAADAPQDGHVTATFTARPF